ncbi:MAG: hypothetical protein ACJ8LG_25465 [Massilia sp.]
MLAKLVSDDGKRLNRRGVEAIAGVPLRVRQAQPLHQRGGRFTAGEEHSGKTPPPGRRRGGGQLASSRPISAD